MPVALNGCELIYYTCIYENVRLKSVNVQENMRHVHEDSLPNGTFHVLARSKLVHRLKCKAVKLHEYAYMGAMRPDMAPYGRVRCGMSQWKRKGSTPSG